MSERKTDPALTLMVRAFAIYSGLPTAPGRHEFAVLSGIATILRDMPHMPAESVETTLRFDGGRPVEWTIRDMRTGKLSMSAIFKPDGSAEFLDLETPDLRDVDAKD